MIESLTKLFAKGGMRTFTLRYYSADVEASWTFDDEGLVDPSLQIVWNRSLRVNDEVHDENFWLYLSPQDAAAVGAVLTAWAESHGEKL
jgi:hypothetical protein